MFTYMVLVGMHFKLQLAQVLHAFSSFVSG
jgi:hypothetical protein